ncbi:MAG: hypothetical protein COA91_12860 [Robiginitomaculum sp.]|nr:MAG: hypothetical protein COA91_12860 [Robiginitomaculum sp.]
MASKKIKLGNVITLLVLSTVLTGPLSSCQAGNTPSNTVKVNDKGRNITSNNVDITPIPSILALFACKPSDAAFVAAHRSTHKGSKFPENAIEGLQALYDNSVPFAVINVARLKDGTQIVFHDDTWDRGSTGTGPITATDWAASQLLFLKDTNGEITSYHPSAFADVLAFAKDKLYLEIDFNASVDEAKVIDSIRTASMLGQVILISYNSEQALRLHKLAPKAALSVGINKPSDLKIYEQLGIPENVLTAWTGAGPITDELAETLRTRKIPILAGSFFGFDDILQTSGDLTPYIDYAVYPDLIVTDYAFDVQPVLEIAGDANTKMENCLNERP